MAAIRKIRGSGRKRRAPRHLLATSSIIAVIVAVPMPASAGGGQAINGGTSAGFALGAGSNTAFFHAIGATVTGNIVNNGTIAPGGLGGPEPITSAPVSAAVLVRGGSFGGSVSNGGTIIQNGPSPGQTGVSLSTLIHGGGITNTGLIGVTNTNSPFNSSTNAAATGVFIVANHGQAISAQILNSGVVTVTTTGSFSGSKTDGSFAQFTTGILMGVSAGGGFVNRFGGNVSNAGTITGGNITNTGTIMDLTSGELAVSGAGIITAVNSNVPIAVSALGGSLFTGTNGRSVGSTFMGDITNSGTLVGELAGSVTANAHTDFSATTNAGSASAVASQIGISLSIASVTSAKTGDQTTNATLTSNVLNSGSILLSNNARISATTTGASSSSAVASASDVGIELTVGGGDAVHNGATASGGVGAGTIVNAGAIVIADQSHLSATFVGGAAFAFAGATGIAVSVIGGTAHTNGRAGGASFTGAVTNSGLISIVQNASVATNGLAGAIATINAIGISVSAGGGSVSVSSLTKADGAVIDGAVANTGTIMVSNFATLSTNDTPTIAADGILITANRGNAFGGGTASGGTYVGGVSNAGTILAFARNASMPVTVSGVLLQALGGLVGSVGQATGGTLTGNVSNSGLISVSGSSGNQAAVAGIQLAPISPVLNNATADVLGTIASSVVNSGTILASASAPGPGSFANGIRWGGTVSNVAQTGVVTGAIVNSGVIKATGTGGASGVGIAVLVPVTGGITNSGTISGNTAAIDLSHEVGGATAITLAGGLVDGAINGNAVQSDTIMIPAGATATLSPRTAIANVASVSGAVGSTLALQVTPSTAPGTFPTVSAGSISLAGVQAVEQFGIYQNSQLYPLVLSGTPTVTGPVTSFSPLFTVNLAQSTNALGDSLTLNRIAFNAVGGLSPNQLAAATALESAFNNGAPPAAMTPLFSTLFTLDRSQLQTAFAQLDNAGPLTAGYLPSREAMLLLMQTTQNRTIVGQVYGAGGAGANFTSPNIQVAAANGSVATAPAGSADSSGFWMRGYGGFANADASAGEGPYHQSRGGVIAGADIEIASGWTLGGAFQFDHAEVNFTDGTGDRDRLDTYQGAIYGGYRAGPWYAIATGGIGFGDQNTLRNITLPLTSAAQGSFASRTYGVSGESGYKISAAGFTVTPLIGLDYIHVSTDAFTESGSGGEALTVQSSGTDSFTSRLGLKISTRIPLAGHGDLVPEVKAAWSHEFADENETVTAAFAPAPTSIFTVTGARFGRDAALIGAGVSQDVSGSSRLFIDYSAQLQGGYTEHIFSAGFRAQF